MSFYRLIKSFGIKAVRCGLLGCNGLNRGVENKAIYGATCKCLTYHLSSINTFSTIQPVPRLMCACESLGNTKTKKQIFLPLSTQTGSKVILQWPQFLLGRVEQKYGLQLAWRRYVFYIWPAILFMTYVYSEFLCLHLDLVSCFILKYPNTDPFQSPDILVERGDYA